MAHWTPGSCFRKSGASATETELSLLHTLRSKSSA